jgi:hypothetical protein
MAAECARKAREGFGGMLKISIDHAQCVSLGEPPSVHYGRRQAVSSGAPQNSDGNLFGKGFRHVCGAIGAGIVYHDQFVVLPGVPQGFGCPAQGFLDAASLIECRQHD